MTPHEPASESYKGIDQRDESSAEHIPGPPRPVVHFSGDALQSITREIQAGGDELETGGILLGHNRGGDVLVTVAGGPGPKAVRRPGYFLRDRDHAQQLADAAWVNDASQWIGDWHTHPHGPSHPSSLDLRSVAQILSDPELGFSTFLTVIAVPRLLSPVGANESTRDHEASTAGWSLLGWQAQGSSEALTLINVF